MITFYNIGSIDLKDVRNDKDPSDIFIVAKINYSDLKI